MNFTPPPGFDSETWNKLIKLAAVTQIVFWYLLGVTAGRLH